MKQGHDLYLRGFWRTDFDPVMNKVERIDVKRNTIRLLDIPEGGMGSKWSMDAPGVGLTATPDLSVTSSTYMEETDPAGSDSYADREFGTVHHNVYAESPATVTAQVYRVGSGTEGWQAVNLLDGDTYYFFDNILVDTGMIAHNTRIKDIRLTDLEGFTHSDSSIHPQTSNRAVLSVFPNINKVYAQIGLFKDPYRPNLR